MPRNIKLRNLGEFNSPCVEVRISGRCWRRRWLPVKRIHGQNPIKNLHSAASLRIATSTMEVVVAIALLAAATTMVGGFVHQVKAGLRDRELSTRCDWELMNARERIGSWPVEQITLQQIQQIPLSESLTAHIANAHLSASIQKIERPQSATQITIAIEGELNEQTIQPSVLTFWVLSITGETTAEGNL